MTATSRTLFAFTEIDLVYRNKLKAADRIKVSDPSMAYNLLMTIWDIEKIELVEQFYMMMLDRKLGCMGVSHLATGGSSSCTVDPKIVFSTALKANASSIILAHNHPSGNLQPSTQDKLITQKLHEGGKLLNIFVDDHLIVTANDYFSFADDGLIARDSNVSAYQTVPF